MDDSLVEKVPRIDQQKGSSLAHQMCGSRAGEIWSLVEPSSRCWKQRLAPVRLKGRGDRRME